MFGNGQLDALIGSEWFAQFICPFFIKVTLTREYWLYSTYVMNNQRQ